MKKLTQAVFENAPDWVKSAAVNDDGELWVFNYPKSQLIIRNDFGGYFDTPDSNNAQCYLFDSGYDTTDWQLSAIDRE